MQRRNSPLNTFMFLSIIVVWYATSLPVNADTRIQFVDATQEAGIHYKHNKLRHQLPLPE